MRQLLVPRSSAAKAGVDQRDDLFAWPFARSAGEWAVRGIIATSSSSETGRSKGSLLRTARMSCGLICQALRCAWRAFEEGEKWLQS